MPQIVIEPPTLPVALKVRFPGVVTEPPTLLEIDTTQPNLSQHLAVLFKIGVLAKRKEGTQVIYRVQSEKAVALCRSVCTQIAIEMDEPDAVPDGQALSPLSTSPTPVMV